MLLRVYSVSELLILRQHLSCFLETRCKAEVTDSGSVNTSFILSVKGEKCQ